MTSVWFSSCSSRRSVLLSMTCPSRDHTTLEGVSGLHRRLTSSPSVMLGCSINTGIRPANHIRSIYHIYVRAAPPTQKPHHPVTDVELCMGSTINIETRPYNQIRWIMYGVHNQHWNPTIQSDTLNYVWGAPSTLKPDHPIRYDELYMGSTINIETRPFNQIRWI